MGGEHKILLFDFSSTINEFIGKYRMIYVLFNKILKINQKKYERSIIINFEEGDVVQWVVRYFCWAKHIAKNNFNLFLETKVSYNN